MSASARRVGLRAARAAVCGALLLCACAEGITGPGLLELPPANTGFDWLVCDAVESSFRMEQVTGGEAAVITHPSGHSLAVPAGALPVGTTVSFTLLEPRSRHVVLEVTTSEQIALAEPLELTLDFGGRSCTVGGAAVDPETLTVFRVRFDGMPHEPLPTSLLLGSRITVTLGELSTFGIGGAS